MPYQVWADVSFRVLHHPTPATPDEARSLPEAASGDWGEVHAEVRHHMSAFCPTDTQDNGQGFSLFVRASPAWLCLTEKTATSSASAS